MLIRNGMLALLLTGFASGLLAQTNDARILILSPQKYFATTNIASCLEAELVADGRYTNVAVTCQDIVRSNTYAEALLGFCYHPDYRDANLALINTGNWTHVVMVDKPFYSACAVELHFEAVDHLSRVIRSAGAQPVLMMPWLETATVQGIASTNTLVREYTWRVGDGVGVTVAPAGSAWTNLGTEFKGSIPLSPYGGVGINENGSYSAACSLYTCLTGSNAFDLAYSPPGLTAEVRDAIASNAYAVALAEQGAVHYTGPFQSRCMKIWPAPAGSTIAVTGYGSSSEGNLANQLKTIITQCGQVSGSASPPHIMFSRLWGTVTNSNTEVTMAALFDKEAAYGVAAARYVEYYSYYNWYYTSLVYSNTMIPYHLLWAKTLYDLRIPIPEDSGFHAVDWQFYAGASAMYTLRIGGSNGVYRNNSPVRFSTPDVDNKRYCWQTGTMAWQTMWQMTSLTQAPPAVVRPYGLDRMNEAEYSAARSPGCVIDTNATWTYNLAGLTNDMFAVYPVDYSTNPPLAMTFFASVAGTNGGSIEVRDNGTNGALLNTCSLSSTGSRTNWQEFGCLVTNMAVSGVRDLALIFKGSGNLPDLDYFRLSVLARTNESCWVATPGGSFNNPTNWTTGIPDGQGKLARFSFDTGHGLYSNMAVTLDGNHTLGTLELGHGVGSGGMSLVPGSGGILTLDVASGSAAITKISGTNDVIAVPVTLADPLTINSGSVGSSVEFAGSVAGGKDISCSGNVKFSGSGNELGRYEYMNLLQTAGNATTWSGSGVMSNLYIKGFCSFNLPGGILVNNGCTEIGYDDSNYEATSAFSISGGLYRHAGTNTLRVGKSNRVTTTVNLLGGVFETVAPFERGTNSIVTTLINLNGGLLKYSGTNDVAMLMNTGILARVGASGAKIEITEAGADVTMGAQLVSDANPDGGLIKSGAGTLVLAASNQWSTVTEVQGGTLRMTGPNSIPSGLSLCVAASATLDLGGYPLTVSGFSGGGTVTNGSLTVSGSVTLPNEKLKVSGNLGLTGPTWISANDVEPCVMVGGVATLGGSFTLMLTGAAISGTNIVLVQAASVTGSFTPVSLPAGWELRYTTTNVQAVLSEWSVAVPGGVSATDGTYEDQVVVTWLPAVYATSYRVWRKMESSLFSGAEDIGVTSETNLTDTTLEPNRIHYYWVCAMRSGATSEVSLAEAGHASMQNITNVVPYRESFEDYTTNSVLVGRRGWYAAGARAIAISENSTLLTQLNSYGWHFPILTNHARVANVFIAPVTNCIVGPVGTNTWVDMMIRFPTRRSDNSPPADGAQCGFILGTGGLIRAYHYSPEGGTNAWIDYLNAPVSTGEWVRLTAQLDHHCAHPGYPGRGWFQCYLNGQLLTNDVALTSPDAAGVAGGSWLQLAVTNVSQMTSLSLEGVVAVDDILVDTVIPRGLGWTVRATAGPHGWVSPAGSTVVWSGSNVTVDIHADQYCDIKSVLVDGMTQGVVSQYVFVAVTNDRSLTAEFTEQLATNSTPLWWLAGYGHSNAFDAAALTDDDLDGMTNWQEYVAGTDPTSRGSVLLVSSPTAPALGSVVLQWPSSADRVYYVDRSTNLVNGFVALASNLPAHPPVNCYTDVVNQAGPLFYRIRVGL